MKEKRNRNVIITVVAIVFFVAVMVGTVVFVERIFGDTRTEAAVTVTGDGFQVSGMYGKSFLFKDVTSIGLADALPAVTLRTNGAALGTYLKGYFNVTGMGNCLLYVSSAEGPYVFVDVAGRNVILNFQDAAKTRQLYTDLKTAWGK